jgi:hypothetical protein
MDIDTSLYMSKFLKMRDDLGTMELYPLKNVLYENLYEDLKPAKIINEVKDVGKEIEEKTIHMLKKADQNVFFPDLPELDIPKDKQEDIPEVKTITLEETGESLQDSTKKKIIIDPKYMATDK